MQKSLSFLIARPWIIFAGFFVVLFVLDTWFGPDNYIPTWNAHAWFAEVLALILTALVLIVSRKFSLKSLPWFLTALSVTVFTLCVFTTHINEAEGTRYDTLLGKPYYALQNTIPYYTPFHQAERDHLLFGDGIEMLQTQIFIVVPFALGYTIYWLRKPPEEPKHKQ